MANARRGTADTYTGRSGQRAVMAELLIRQCNVAIPEVDTGEDVFAFRDDRPEVARIQVKTAQTKGYKRKAGYPARFGIPIRQLRRPEPPELFYALAVRLGALWADFVVISRAQLRNLWEGPHPFGRENPASGNLELDLVFEPDHVWCSGIDLQAFRNAWETLAPLRPVPVPRTPPKGQR